MLLQILNLLPKLVGHVMHSLVEIYQLFIPNVLLTADLASLVQVLKLLHRNLLTPARALGVRKLGKVVQVGALGRA